MWSSVTEQITDGTSGLTPGGQPSAVLIGTSSKGTHNTAYAIGKKSDYADTFGSGTLPDTIQYMQNTMSDVTTLAIRVEGSSDISDISTDGDINIEVLGTPTAKVDCEISILTEGTSGQAEVVVTCGDDFEETHLIPDDGILAIDELGITVAFPIDVDYTTVNKWTFSTSTPVASFEVIEDAINNILEAYTPEVIVIAQTVDADFVNKLGSLSESLFEDHKPTLFLTNTELDSSKSYTEAIADKQLEFAKIDARFVSVVCQPLSDDISALGLCAGHTIKARVNQSIGATNYFGIYDATLPDDWTNVYSRALDEGRFITLRTYAGLNNIFWTNGRTMASGTSDYRFIEVVRTVFKAIRLARIASLPYIQADGDDIGLQNLLAEIRNTLETMVTTSPKELDSYEVEIPSGQDIVNDGVRLDISLFGIPIIRSILLNFMFRYNESE